MMIKGYGILPSKDFFTKKINAVNKNGLANLFTDKIYCSIKTTTSSGTKFILVDKKKKMMAQGLHWYELNFDQRIVDLHIEYV